MGEAVSRLIEITHDQFQAVIDSGGKIVGGNEGGWSFDANDGTQVCMLPWSGDEGGHMYYRLVDDVDEPWHHEADEP